MKLIKESLRRTYNPTRFENFLDTFFSGDMIFFGYPMILLMSFLVYKIIKLIQHF